MGRKRYEYHPIHSAPNQDIYSQMSFQWLFKHFKDSWCPFTYNHLQTLKIPLGCHFMSTIKLTVSHRKVWTISDNLLILLKYVFEHFSWMCLYHLECFREEERKPSNVDALFPYSLFVPPPTLMFPNYAIYHQIKWSFHWKIETWTWLAKMYWPNNRTGMVTSIKYGLSHMVAMEIQVELQLFIAGREALRKRFCIKY